MPCFLPVPPNPHDQAVAEPHQTNRDPDDDVGSGCSIFCGEKRFLHFHQRRGCRHTSPTRTMTSQYLSQPQRCTHTAGTGGSRACVRLEMLHHRSGLSSFQCFRRPRGFGRDQQWRLRGPQQRGRRRRHCRRQRQRQLQQFRANRDLSFLLA